MEGMIAAITVNQGTRSCRQGATLREEVFRQCQMVQQSETITAGITAAGQMTRMSWLPCRSVVWKGKGGGCLLLGE